MIRRLWRRYRALVVMGRHERYRVAMGCPGAPRYEIGPQERRLTPVRGEVYCRCDCCHRARAELGWEQVW